MIVLFCRSRTVISWLIRLITWSDWSHCVVLHPDGIRTLEARWPRVAASTLPAVLADNDIVRAVRFPCAYPQTAWTWGIGEVGNDYSVLGDLGILLHRDWRRPGTWECAGFVTELLARGGSPPFRLEVLDRVSPQSLWMLPYPEVKL